MSRKRVEENERIKRRYLHFLREAKRADLATVDIASDAILRFERSTDFKPFKRFHIEQPSRFKAQLFNAVSQRTGKPLAKSTIDGILRAVKAFFLWLADQQGYRSKIRYGDAEYFNLNAKDVRIAHAERDAPFPTEEQCRYAFDQMPSATPIQLRNRAVFALIMLTGARDGAIASLRLKHVDIMGRCIHQDAREVKTKFAKTFTTWFFPVDPVYLQAFMEWVSYLRNVQLFGPNDAIFPKPKIGRSAHEFAIVGLSRETYSNAAKIRDVIKTAFFSAGLQPFGPHSFRKTLGVMANKFCKTPEQYKAWSMNLGHESIATTLYSYTPVSSHRQAELILGMSEVGNSDPTQG